MRRVPGKIHGQNSSLSLLDDRSVNNCTIVRGHGTLPSRRGAYAFCEETKVLKSY
jgi:hypothetical protein